MIINPYNKIVGNESGLIVGLDMILDGSGDLVNKASGYENLTITQDNIDSSNYSMSKVGPVCTMNGTDERITIADNAALSFANDMSIVIVCKRNATGEPCGIVSKYGTAQANKEYVCGWLADDVLYWWTLDANTGGYRGRKATDATNTDGNYHLYVFTNEAPGAVGDHKIYCDGSAIDDENFTSGAYTQMRDGSDPCYIGFNVSGLTTNGYSNMDIAYVKILNRAVTTTEISNMQAVFDSAYNRNKSYYNIG